MWEKCWRYFRRWHRTAYLGLAAAMPVLLLGGLYYHDFSEQENHKRVLERLELAAGDRLRGRGRPAAVRSDLVFLGIDNASLTLDTLWPEDIAASPALQLMSEAKGSWNWSRAIYAAVLDRLMAAGAKLVVFDLVMPKENAGDAAFRAALDRYPHRVVVGFEYAPTEYEDRVFLPASLFADPAHDPRVGYVNYGAEAADGVIRQMSFALYDTRANIYYESLVARALRQMGRADCIPADRRPRIFRFTDLANGKGYPARSLYEIFVEPLWKQNYQNGAFFRDKVVIIGAAARTLHDFQATSLGELPGPEIHLEALTAALAGEYLTATSVPADLAIIVAAGLLAWGLGVLVRQPLVRLGLLVGISGCLVLLLFWLYNHYGLLPAIVTPLLAFNLGGLTGLVGEYVVERAEKARVRGVLDRLVSKDIVRELLQDRESYAALVRGQRRPVTVLFSDVRGFTTLSEAADDPAAFIAQLNEYLGEMVDVVFKHRGTVDKFIGDAVMAVWGSMHTDGENADARQAVAAALEMRTRLATLNAQWAAAGKFSLAIGIGVNYGEVIVGGLGSEKSKMEITVMGDAVNTASRLEGLTKDYGLDLLIGETVAARVSEVFRLRTVDLVRVKGKKKPTEVMTVLGPLSDLPTPAQEERFADYEDAILLYRRREFAAARKLLAGCLQNEPNDCLAALYLGRCDELIDQEPAAEWDGVRLMTTK